MSGGGWLRREFMGAGVAALAVPRRARAAPTADPASILVLGDWGMDGKHAQRAVARSMALAAAETNARLVLTTGDNFYPAGVSSAADSQWKTSFEDIYAAGSLQIPWYAALGNHDYRGEPAAQVAYGGAGRRWQMPDRYYCVRPSEGGLPADVEIFVLDTTPMAPEFGEKLMRIVRYGRTSMPDPAPQVLWLQAQLARSTAAWKIVVGHHPIHSGGHHGGSAGVAARIEPLLERYGVQAYLCGHDHVLQHIQAGRTHHICSGSGASAGAVATVRGGRFAGAVPGFAVLSFDPGGDRLRLDLRGADAATLYSAEIPRTA
jgi:acid phosphatase